jgi:hypothetical protein
MGSERRFEEPQRFARVTREQGRRLASRCLRQARAQGAVEQSARAAAL